MSPARPGGGALGTALRAALQAVAAGPGGGVVVAAPDDPVPGTPGRFVPVSGARARVGVAAGLALAGRPAVVLAGTEVPALLPRTAGLVAVVAEGRIAGAWWGAGWTLVQPAWPDDVGPLLAGALAAPGPVVLRVGPAAPPEAVPAAPATLGVPRVLRAGTVGLLAACGPQGVRLLVDVSRILAGRGVALQAVELHTAGPGEGPGPEVTDRALLLGDAPLTAQPGQGWPSGLRAVRVPDDPTGAMEAVAARLRAARSG